MKKCKFCQEELAENSTVCPNCGKDNAEILEAAAEETAVPAEETAEAVEEIIAEQTAPVPEETAAPAEKKKATPGKIALAVAAVVVLAGVLIALIVTGLNGKDAGGTIAAETSAETSAAAETVPATVPADGNPEDVTCKGTYTVSDEEVAANREIAVATIGENQLTNGQLQVYYWSMVNSYLSSEYGYYMMMYGAIDYTQPLDTQISVEDESLTWQQYFLNEALNYWQMSQALSGEAMAAGMEMSEADREYLDNLAASLEETAAAYDMTVEELLLSNVGPGAGLEEFARFQELYCEGKDFYQAELAKMTPTQEELEAFFTEHEADYASSGITRDDKYVDVRHILIQIEGGTTGEDGTTTYSDEEWAACEAEAQAILDEWKKNPTEENFAALANEKSEDPGSNTNGGLYENVYVGQMVEPFETWCFDESRAYGDTGLVQTSYGYHVMYYVGSEPMWISYAESDWINEQSNAFLEQLTSGYPMDVEFDKISLGYIDLG